MKRPHSGAYTSPVDFESARSCALLALCREETLSQRSEGVVERLRLRRQPVCLLGPGEFSFCFLCLVVRRERPSSALTVSLNDEEPTSGPTFSLLDGKLEVRHESAPDGSERSTSSKCSTQFYRTLKAPDVDVTPEALLREIGPDIGYQASRRRCRLPEHGGLALWLKPRPRRLGCIVRSAATNVGVKPVLDL